MDDTRTVTYHLLAEDEVQGWLQRHRPALVIRCRERKTDVYVQTGMASSVEYGLHDEHTVRLRFDEAPARRERWTDSTDNEALFAPNAVATARRVAGARELLFEFTPFNASPALVRFDLGGSTAIVTHVATTCGWKP